MATALLTNDFFPQSSEKVPFGDFIEGIFFNPIKDNHDYPIHGPNVIRLTKGLLSLNQIDQPIPIGLFKDESDKIVQNNYTSIMEALGVDMRTVQGQAEYKKILDILSIAALYHDIGKYIRRANHPQIGANLVRNFDQGEQTKLVEALNFSGDSNDASKHSRFALIVSIIQHHDKFGVVSTGEGGLPIFSDILYFTSDQSSIKGIIKNITSVMLLNLSDIAAVNTAKKDTKEKSLKIAHEIFELRNKARSEKIKNKDGVENKLLSELKEICKQNESCLGLNERKVTSVLNDWQEVINAIDHDNVKGNRVQLKQHLLWLEKNPSRTIQRILRLIQEAALTSNSKVLVDIKYISPTTVESVLVGTLGAHQFQSFCEQFATVVKLDYGLNFFKTILCACIRKEIHDEYNSIKRNSELNLSWTSINNDERDSLIGLPEDRKSYLANKITVLFVKVLAGLVSRYSGVLNYSTLTPRRFGFQMRDLTIEDPEAHPKDKNKIRDTIIDLLCIQEISDSIALTWIVDEVAIWSFD